MGPRKKTVTVTYTPKDKDKSYQGGATVSVPFKTQGGFITDVLTIKAFVNVP